MTIEERFEKIREMDEAINRKLQRKDEIMRCGTKITPSLDGMPHAPGVSDKVGSAAQKIADLEAEIDRNIDDLVAYKEEMHKLICSLPKLHYDVLRLYYIRGMSIGQVGEELHYTPQYMATIRKQALNKLKDSF